MEWLGGRRPAWSERVQSPWKFVRHICPVKLSEQRFVHFVILHTPGWAQPIRRNFDEITPYRYPRRIRRSTHLRPRRLPHVQHHGSVRENMSRDSSKKHWSKQFYKAQHTFIRHNDGYDAETPSGFSLWGV